MIELKPSGMDLEYYFVSELVFFINFGGCFEFCEFHFFSKFPKNIFFKKKGTFMNEVLYL